MQKRRSHKKSRRGCLNCKKWHTKCDEAGPPCNNCRLREAKCEYACKATGGEALALIPSHGSSGSPNPTSHSDRSGSRSASPSSLWGPRRLLELELMHQWSTCTYTSLCGVPEDHYYLQSIVPRAAMKYDYLMNGIFVASALHIASMSEPSKARTYVNLAMELYDKASSSFRSQLGNINRDNHHVIYIFSTMTAFINIAFAQFLSGQDGIEPTILSRVATAFDLLNGSLSIALADYQQLLDGPVPVRAYLSYGNASADLIGTADRAALVRLELLNETYHGVLAESAGDVEPEFSATVKMYRKAIACLKLCFAEDARDVMHGSCFLFPVAAGVEFGTAVKENEPMALLILLHFTVLLDRVSHEFWWAKNLGKRIALGITNVLAQHYPTLMLQWQDIISWILIQIGLSDIRLLTM